MYLSVAALALTLAPTLSAPTASADAVLQCAANAPIYTTRYQELIQYRHREPETGANSWDAQQQLGTWGGLAARHVAGPNGVIYNAAINGELRRQRWNGTTWDSFPNGLDYEIIDTNPVWARYVTAEYVNRITVDTLGDIYTIEPDGNLHWRRYDPIARTWAHRAVTTFDYEVVDLITAAGPGIIYARHGTWLERFAYHAASQRALVWSPHGGTWDAFSRIFSPGGDVLYAVRADTGDLMWYRYNPDTFTWASGEVADEPVGTRIGTGWQRDFESFAAPDACQLSSATNFWPARPLVTPWPHAPVTLGLSRDGRKLLYSYVDEDGRAVYADATELTGGAPIRLAAVPGMTDLTGTTATVTIDTGRVLIVGNGLDAEVYSNATTSPGGPWGQAVSHGGFFSKPATPLYLSNIHAADQNDSLWSRSKFGWAGPNGPTGVLGTWRPAHAPTVPFGDSPLIVTPRDSATSATRFISYNRSTTSFSVTDNDRGGSGWYDWVGLGGSGFLDRADLAWNPIGEAFIYATGTDNTVYYQELWRYGSSGNWTAVPGVHATGPPSATRAPDGTIKVVVRGTDPLGNDLLYYTSQTAPCSTTFDPWRAIPDSDDTGTDPTATSFGGTWVVAYRTDFDLPQLRVAVPGSSAAAATQSGPFINIPLTPPA